MINGSYIDVVRQQKLEERQQTRSLNHVVVPYLETSYRNWLKQKGYKDEDIATACQDLQTMDDQAFLYQTDLYLGLPRITSSDSSLAIVGYFFCFQEVLEDLHYKVMNLKSDLPIDVVMRWQESLKLYRDFFLVNIQTPFQLFNAEDFVQWFSEYDSPQTAELYVDYVVRLQKDFFSKTRYATSFAVIEFYMENNQDCIIPILNEMERELDFSVSHHRISTIPGTALPTYQSGFHMYCEYMKYLILGKTTISRRKSYIELEEKDYDYGELLNYFFQQILHKDFTDAKRYKTFFPIEMIYKICKKRDQEFPEEESLAAYFIIALFRRIDDAKIDVAYNPPINYNQFCLDEISSLEIIPYDKVRVYLDEDKLHHDEELADLYDDDRMLLDGSQVWINGKFIKIKDLNDLEVVTEVPMDEPFKEFLFNKPGLEALTQMLLDKKSKSNVMKLLTGKRLYNLAQDLLDDFNDIVSEWDLKIVVKEDTNK